MVLRKAGRSMSSVLFLEYPKCSTCRKAKKWLDEHGVSYEDRHIVEENPTSQELKDWQEMSGLPIKKFFNTSGVLYRELKIKDRFAEGMDDDEALKLLGSNGMLVKRPLIVGENFVLTGFKEAEWKVSLL